MKKFLCFVAVIMGMMLFVAPKAQSQTKIGYISLQELIPLMPEYKKAESDMSEYQKALIQQGTDYQAEFYRKDSIFKADSIKHTAAMKEIKRKELNELYLKWVNFQQQAQTLVQQREQELLAPIQQKAVQTTQAVAKENGYLYVLSKDQLIAFPASEDILPLVAKKLNLKLEDKAAANPPATNLPQSGTSAPKKNN
jgi:outer membrane protein